MYVIKNSEGKYLSRIDHDGITFSSFVEDAIASRVFKDLVLLFGFLSSYLFSFSTCKIVKLSEYEESDFFFGLKNSPPSGEDK